MPLVSYNIAADGSSISVAGSDLAAGATMALAVQVNGVEAFSINGPTAADGTIAAVIPIADASLQAVLPLIGSGTWSDASSSWAVSNSDGATTVSMTANIA